MPQSYPEKKKKKNAPVGMSRSCLGVHTTGLPSLDSDLPSSLVGLKPLLVQGFVALIRAS